MKKIVTILILFLSIQHFKAQDESTNTGPFTFTVEVVRSDDQITDKNPYPLIKIYVQYENKKVYLTKFNTSSLSDSWEKPNKKKNQLARAMAFYGGGGEDYCLVYTKNSIRVYKKYIETEGDGVFKDELIKTIPLSAFTKDTAKAIQEINKYLGKK